MKYRKKPIVVDAFQFHAGQEEAFMKLLPRGQAAWSSGGLFINTPEGTMKVSDGDWVIRGVAGEYYPCRPDIFEKSYEALEDGTDAVCKHSKPNNSGRRYCELFEFGVLWCDGVNKPNCVMLEDDN